MGWRDFFLPKSKSDDHVREPLAPGHLEQYVAVVRDLSFGFDNVNDHVIITDPNANIIYANKAAQRDTGFSRDEMLGKNPADLWGGQMPKDFYEKMWHTIKIEKQPFVGEVKNKRKDGAEYWQEIHISPVLWENGEIKFFIGIEPNITEYKEKEKFREEFISILAHQAKNPLATIRWTLDWMAQKGGLSPEQREGLEKIYEQDQGLINLISDLLVMSRMADAQMTTERIDIANEVNTIIMVLKERFAHVFFSFQKGDKNFPLVCSKSLALQVLSNIINNAAEYSDRQAGIVEIVLRDEDEKYIFSCKDNGIGIPPEDQPKIFTRLFRASNANERKETGTGLGLFIVKMIAGNLHWNVRFESMFGKGTTFWVEIPKVS